MTSRRLHASYSSECRGIDPDKDLFIWKESDHLPDQQDASACSGTSLLSSSGSPWPLLSEFVPYTSCANNSEDSHLGTALQWRFQRPSHSRKLGLPYSDFLLSCPAFVGRTPACWRNQKAFLVPSCWPWLCSLRGSCPYHVLQSLQCSQSIKQHL